MHAGVLSAQKPDGRQLAQMLRANTSTAGRRERVSSRAGRGNVRLARRVNCTRLASALI